MHPHNHPSGKRRYSQNYGNEVTDDFFNSVVYIYLMQHPVYIVLEVMYLLHLLINILAEFADF